MTNIMWSSDNVKLLISEIQLRPNLWDARCQEYRDKVRKNQSWEEISDILKVPPDEVKKKFHTLRVQFNSCLKKIKKPGSPGGTTPKWQLFHALQFLTTGHKQKKMETSVLHTNTDIGKNKSEENQKLSFRKRKQSDSNIKLVARESPVVENEYELFGRFIAAEMKTFTPKNAKRFKLEVTKLLANFQEMEESGCVTFYGHLE